MSTIFSRVFPVLLMLSLLVAGVIYWQLQDYLDRPLQIDDSGLEYSLQRGSSLTAVAYSLQRQGVLQSPRWLTVYSRLSGRGVKIKAGDYLLEQGLTARQLLQKLERGDVQYFQVTLVEGWNLWQLQAALAAQPRLAIKLEDFPLEQKSIAQILGIDASVISLDGLFFPDTYRYHSAMTDIDILQRAQQRLQSVLAEEWKNRGQKLPYSSPYEALIMASLVEKETGDASERAQIAGVFVRRLAKGMRLQTDPAVIFGLGPQFDGNLRRRHLKDASNPYNTYRHHGLTPTPIALVGRAAIHAALHPAEGDSLYFVAKGDGSHYFSRTLKEHQKAVRKYQVYQRRKDYSSAPSSKKPS